MGPPNAGGAMEWQSDPFASFLSKRPAGLDGSMLRSKGGAFGVAAMPSVQHLNTAEDASAFAAFLSVRPRPPPPTVEEELREDVLRVKRQLLELEVKAELRELEAEPLAEGDPERMKRVRRAQRYLQHPERIGRAFSGDLSDENDMEETVKMARSPSSFMGKSTAVKLSDSQSSFASDGRVRQRQSVRVADPAHGLDRTLSCGALGRTNGLDSTMASLPPIVGSESRCGSPFKDRDPLLSGFWTGTRCWNSIIGNQGQFARRIKTEKPGGCVVFGNAKAPLFQGTRLLTQGYFYGFKIDGIDDSNFPLRREGTLTIGFGLSRRPPRHPSCQHPHFAYTVPETVIIGYGSKLIDGRKWQTFSRWDPSRLEVNDVVGVLLLADGDIVVFVNGEQKLRVPTSFAGEGFRKEPTAVPRRIVYPILDLHGRVTSVTILPRMRPPNVPLTPVNTVETYKGVPS